MKLIDICIEAFKRSNSYGEKPTGVIREITFIKPLKQYMVSIELENNSSTDIDIVELCGDDYYRVHSGKSAFLTKKTATLQKELSKAIEVEI